METGLVYNSVDESLKAEDTMRGELERPTAAIQKEYRAMPTSPNYIAKQGISGTCIPHAGVPR